MGDTTLERPCVFAGRLQIHLLILMQSINIIAVEL